MIELAGRRFKDPIIVASGALPHVDGYIREVCRRYRPSAITLKTLTVKPLEPHRPPTLFKFGDGSYLNAIGLGNPGVGFINELDGIECPIIASVTGQSLPEILKAVEAVDPKAYIIELNLSSPNRPGYGVARFKDSVNIVREAKSIATTPIFVKMPPIDPITEYAGRILDAGADGLTMINTLKGMIIDVEELKPILSYGTGGVSGKCIYPLAVRMIAEVYREYQPEIIGVGGVYTWRDAVGMIAAGAKLVGLCSVIIDRGPQIIKEIREGMRIYLERKGLRIESLIGMASMDT